ncbi:hypothetical protein VTL71DRAFT_10262 [Oculimacula yallundae]|uniref:Uncharacterized protein n=1 Tax=Oculimacula yallundae TaxID=86028 RepID=A0ABR4CU90_9HELO
MLFQRPPSPNHDDRFPFLVLICIFPSICCGSTPPRPTDKSTEPQEINNSIHKDTEAPTRQLQHQTARAKKCGSIHHAYSSTDEHQPNLKSTTLDRRSSPFDHEWKCEELSRVKKTRAPEAEGESGCCFQSLLCTCGGDDIFDHDVDGDDDVVDDAKDVEDGS